MIRLNKVSSGYGERIVLRDVSLSLEKGTFTCIIGKNGCGKSTLLKTVLGMVPKREGDILIGGVSIDTIKRKEMAKKLSYLSQGKSVPDMTALQMVLHGRFPHLSYPRRYSKKDMEIALSAMEKMGIDSLAQRPVAALSGGMRQSVYIAMALAQDTDYILLDEPTTYLDINHQLELIKTLRALSDGGKGIVAVMHDIPMALTFADRIVVLDDGILVSEGSPERICSEGTIERVFNITVEPSSDGKGYSYRYLRDL